jgi:hypothetical protein
MSTANQARTFHGKAERDGAAHAGTGSCDESNLAVEPAGLDHVALTEAVGGFTNHTFSSTSRSLFQPSGVRTISWW